LKACDKIEALLWESLERNLTEKERESIESHLSGCDRCKAVSATIEAIAESKRTDQSADSVLDVDEFEAGIFQKIRAREGELRFKKEDRGYMIRLYFSVGLAAAIVAFIVLSLGDLDRYILPAYKESQKTTVPKRKTDTLHITLKPQDRFKPEEPPTAPAEKKGGEIDNKVMQLMPPPTVAKDADTIGQKAILKAGKETPAILKDSAAQVVEEIMIHPEADSVSADATKEGLPKLFAKGKAVPESYLGMESISGKKQTAGDFSILSEPVSNPGPDSVVINSIYLSDESIPMASQQTRAYLPEVIIDSGTVQSMETPRSVLVTVDKMPVAVKIIPPEYPVWARKNGISGDVWVKARVDNDGNVVSAEVLSSSMPGYGFEEAALDAARQSKYLPAEANGFKIPISVIYPVHFIYKDNDLN
jgi:TonB family protein